jgi:hypothetical protein
LQVSGQASNQNSKNNLSHHNSVGSKKESNKIGSAGAPAVESEYYDEEDEGDANDGVET